MSKAKTKGKYLENLVAEEFQKQCNLTKFDVHRNQTSGVFQSEFGDVYFKNLDIIIECKNQEAWDFKHIYLWRKPIIDYWKQLQKDVVRFRQIFHKEPFYFLVVSKTRYPKFAICDAFNIESNVVFRTSIEDFCKHMNFYTIINNMKEPKICIELDQLVKYISDFIKEE